MPAGVLPAEREALLPAEVAEEVAVAEEPQRNFCFPTGHHILRCKMADGHEGQSSDESDKYERRHIVCMRQYLCYFAGAS